MAQLTSPADILNRVDLPIASATGLPNDCYTANETFVRDREHVFAPTWACIGFVDQLPEQNYSVPVDFMGLPLLLTRDKQDFIRVFHNVCSHRGMHLSDKPCKNSGTIRCPYHNWTYDLDGELRSTPNIGGYGVHEHPDFEASNNGLKEVRSQIWLNSIYINLSGQAEPFGEFSAAIRQRWLQWTSDAQLARFTVAETGSRMALTVQSNWKLAVENFLEAYHLPSVHPELNRISPLNQHYCVDPFENGGGQGSRSYQRLQIDETTLPELDAWPPAQAQYAEYPVLYPNTLLGIHADQLFILYLQPLSSHETVEHIRIFYVGEDAGDKRYKSLRERNLNGWKTVFEEDIFAVERMQKGRNSPAYSGGAFSPEMDGPTHHFHKWIARRLATGQLRESGEE